MPNEPYTPPVIVPRALPSQHMFSQPIENDQQTTPLQSSGPAQHIEFEPALPERGKSHETTPLQLPRPSQHHNGPAQATPIHLAQATPIHLSGHPAQQVPYPINRMAPPFQPRPAPPPMQPHPPWVHEFQYYPAHAQWQSMVYPTMQPHPPVMPMPWQQRPRPANAAGYAPPGPAPLVDGLSVPPGYTPQHCRLIPNQPPDLLGPQAIVDGQMVMGPDSTPQSNVTEFPRLLTNHTPIIGHCSAVVASRNGSEALVGSTAAALDMLDDISTSCSSSEAENDAMATATDSGTLERLLLKK